MRRSPPPRTGSWRGHGQAALDPQALVARERAEEDVRAGRDRARDRLRLALAEVAGGEEDGPCRIANGDVVDRRALVGHGKPDGRAGNRDGRRIELEVPDDDRGGRVRGGGRGGGGGRRRGRGDRGGTGRGTGRGTGGRGGRRRARGGAGRDAEHGGQRERLDEGAGHRGTPWKVTGRPACAGRPVRIDCSAD